MKRLLSTSCLILLNLSCIAQDPSAQLTSVEQKLSSGQASVTQVLTDPSYMQLHPLTAFRDLVKRFAKPEKLTLVTSTEPGSLITAKGKIIDNNNKPAGNVLVYVYHTDNKGWYADTAGHVAGMGGDRGHARLFGYFKTNNDGSFEFNTIQPQGYPNSTLPQHIHFEVFDNDGRNLLVTELLFEEDPRLNTAMRQRMLNEGAVIAANSGTKDKPVFSYDIKIK